MVTIHTNIAQYKIQPCDFGTRVLVVKPEGKRPMGRPRRRWKDNINP